MFRRVLYNSGIYNPVFQSIKCLREHIICNNKAFERVLYVFYRSIFNLGVFWSRLIGYPPIKSALRIILYWSERYLDVNESYKYVMEHLKWAGSVHGRASVIFTQLSAVWGHFRETRLHFLKSRMFCGVF